ncbi:hypothetical protein DK880_00772 [Candidatus Cardinium hertigii]|uniref:Uncharacterized protein n=1 Tax=Candidatus Cardinium hertigii TaxID=247481 RepID=A0A2Z3L9P2_9BACT|nr:hypothetical protein DK880_00772 [Candidatus Cardinium hertigii]
MEKTPTITLIHLVYQNKVDPLTGSKESESKKKHS